MKKIFAIALSIMLLLATAACASTTATSPATTATPAVTATPTPTANQPIISIKETAEPKELIYGTGSVTYTYEVTNPGTVALSNVSVTDDKISQVRYVSGDSNSDNVLQKGETWVYNATAKLTETTSSTATAKGSANGITATNTANVKSSYPLKQLTAETCRILPRLGTTYS
jgi:uncharacterized repeat protein (TIGR01451 family)